MGSQYSSVTRIVSKGFDRASQRHLTAADSCYDILNLRPVRGRLEQTPWLTTGQALSTINSETATQIRLLRLVKNVAGTLKYLVINETNARFVDAAAPSGGQTLIPCVLQTKKPNNATITGELLMYGENVTDFSTSGDYIEVAIHTDGSHFRWNRNGGSWSVDIVIAQSVTINGATGLKLSFQGQGDVADFTNYTVGNTWRWTRQDTIPTPTSVTSTFNFPFSADNYERDTYIGGIDRNVMRVRDDFITSIGYSRVYGKHVAVFYNHLFVSQYAPGVYDIATGVADSYDGLTTPFTLGWSHLDNPDQFFATLVNEADSKQLPQQLFSELSNIGITGLAPWRSLLYVFLADAIWSCQYVGLPNVMELTPLNTNVGSYFHAGVVRTPDGIYFIGRSDFYRIKSYEAESIGQRVREKFFAEICGISDNNHQRLHGFYNPSSKEVIWTYWLAPVSAGKYQQRQIVYSEVTDDWYFRNVPCATSGYTDVMCAAPMFNTFGRNWYGYKQTIYQDMATGASSGALTDTFVTPDTGTYTQPQFETPFLHYSADDYWHMKESSALHIDAGWTTGADIQVSRAKKALVGNGSVSFVALNQVWTPTLADNRLSLPQDAYREIVYKFVFRNSSSPVYGGVFNFYQEFVHGPQYHVEK